MTISPFVRDKRRCRGFVTHSNSVPERHPRTHVDGQHGGVDVNMETTVIMELPKDLRRRIFPCCHVSSLPGIKLPVVARCNCIAKQRPAAAAHMPCIQ